MEWETNVSVQSQSVFLGAPVPDRLRGLSRVPRTFLSLSLRFVEHSELVRWFKRYMKN